MDKLKWTTMGGRKVSRSFETKEELILFADILYVNNYDAYGKISVSRPTKQELEKAKAWILRDNPFAIQEKGKENDLRNKTAIP